MLNRSGFTLIEILVVIAIVAILVGLAVPSYEGSVRKTRRADAQKELVKFAGIAERVFTETNSYTSLTVPVPEHAGIYTYTLPVKTATAYTIQAAPVSGQSADKCGTMALTSTGLRTHTGSDSECW